MIIEKAKTLVSQLLCNKCAKRGLEKIIIIYQNRNILSIRFPAEHDSDKNDPAYRVADYRAAITAQGTSHILKKISTVMQMTSKYNIIYYDLSSNVG